MEKRDESAEGHGVVRDDLYAVLSFASSARYVRVMSRPVRITPWCLCVALFVWLPAMARAAEPSPVVIDGQPFLAELGPHLALLQDPSGALTIDDVLTPGQASQFVPASVPVPTFGFTKAAVWMRFEIESRSARDEPLMVELGMARMSRFEWYVVADGRLEQGRQTNHRPGSLRSGDGCRYPTLSLVVPAGGKRTVLARAQTDTSMWLPLTVGSPLEFDNFTARRDFRDFVQVGFCAALSLLGFGLWLAGGRNRQFLGVGVAMAFGLLHAMIFNGLYVWFGGPWPEWFSRQGALLCSMLFTIVFIKFNEDFLGWNALCAAQRRVLAASYVVGAIALAIGLFLPYGIAVKFQLPLQLLALGGAAGVAATQWVRCRGARLGLFTTAWLIFLGSLGLLVMQFNGLLPVLLSPADVMRIIVPSVFVVFLLASANSYRAVLQMQTQVAELREAETSARLESLRYQLNPHFLFNTLTSIQELAHEAPARIPPLVARLADFLRLRLKPEPLPVITLAKELESVRSYLEIEQVRFEERLKVDYDISAEAAACALPEMVLMPLVENAVKYGFEDSDRVGIRLMARVQDGRLNIRVENNGSLHEGRRRGSGAGVGVENIRRRLELRYGSAARFDLRQEGGHVVAEVEIPAQTPQV
ncbi:MAG: hypothetical protein FGM15_01945 [Chthoniobacterales bacterium]|nr:hypothetical protein [Chthoniobacterales bacterium]